MQFFCMYHSLFIHSPTEEHLGFHLLAITKKTSINIMYKFLCGHKFTLLGQHQGAQLLNNRVYLVLKKKQPNYIATYVSFCCLTYGVHLVMSVFWILQLKFPYLQLWSSLIFLHLFWGYIFGHFQGRKPYYFHYSESPYSIFLIKNISFWTIHTWILITSWQLIYLRNHPAITFLLLSGRSLLGSFLSMCKVYEFSSVEASGPSPCAYTSECILNVDGKGCDCLRNPYRLRATNLHSKPS